MVNMLDFKDFFGDFVENQKQLDSTGNNKNTDT
jgi:hypothetical protein